MSYSRLSRRNQVSVGGLLTTAVLSASAGSAIAQQAPAMLEEVVVVAQKREQSLQDVPLAITAMGTEDVERLNAVDIKGIQYSTPNLVVTGANSATQQFGIRGISDYSRNAGYDNRVGVYVDGVWVGRSTASNQVALDIQSIEILRGPQGTLFGKNTVAGAINIVSQRPAEELGGYVSADIGNYDLLQLKGSLNLPLSDTLLSKLTVSNTQRDGYIEDVVSDARYEDKDELALRGQLLWNVTDITEVQLNIDSAENDFKTTIAESTVDPIAPAPHRVALDTRQDMSTKIQGAGLQVNHVFDNDFELVSISGLRKSEWQLVDNDEDYSPAPISSGSTGEESNHFSQELRIASPQYDNFDYIAGLYYLNQENKGAGDATAFAPALNPAAPPIYVGAEHQSVVDVTSYAAFSHGNYTISESLQLTGGLRYTYEKKEIDYQITDTSGLFTNADTSDKRSSSNWSPKISLNWFAGEELMIYGSYSKAYKSGGWNADFIADAADFGFDDEEVDSFEVGVKSTLADGRVRLNVVGFYANYTDFQVFSFVELNNGGTQITVTNAGEVTSQGVEVELQWLINDNFRLWSTYGYTDSTFDQFKNGGGLGVDYDGNNTANAPENNFSLGIEFNYPVMGGELITQLDYSYRDEFYSNPNNLAANLVGSYELFNGRIGFESGSGTWSVYAWGKNLADDIQEINNSVSFLGFPRSVYSEPLTYGLAVKYNFGT